MTKVEQIERQIKAYRRENPLKALAYDEARVIGSKEAMSTLDYTRAGRVPGAANPVLHELMVQREIAKDEGR